MHVGTWEPLGLDVNVRVLVFELGDERVVPVALLAGVALEPIVIPNCDALPGRRRFGRGLRRSSWRSGCWRRRRRGCRWLGCCRGCRWGGRRSGRRWGGAATTRG